MWQEQTIVKSCFLDCAGWLGGAGQGQGDGNFRSSVNPSLCLAPLLNDAMKALWFSAVLKTQLSCDWTAERRQTS